MLPTHDLHSHNACIVGVQIEVLLTLRRSVERKKMKMFLISDNTDTLTGMRLAGVEGVVVHEKEEVKEALESAMSNPENAIIIITEKLSRDFSDLVTKARDSSSLPLVIVIPDRHGTGRSKDFITSYVNEAIGINL